MNPGERDRSAGNEVHLESEVRAGVEAYSSSDAHSSSEHLMIMT